VSNRKYAGLLEGGPQTEETRMMAITSTLADFMNNILKDMDITVDELAIKNIASIVQGRFANIAPELEKEYEVIVGAKENDVTDPLAPPQVFVGYRKKIEPTPWEYIHSIRATTIDSSRVEAFRSDWERMTMGHIHGGTIHTGTIQPVNIDASRIVAAINDSIEDTRINNARIGNIDASRITAGTITAQQINTNAITADRIQPYTVRERYGPMLISPGVGLAQVRLGGDNA
jgi:hypothetical protein